VVSTRARKHNPEAVELHPNARCTKRGMTLSKDVVIAPLTTHAQRAVSNRREERSVITAGYLLGAW